MYGHFLNVLSGKQVEMILLCLFRYTLAWHTTGLLAYLPEILSDFWIGALPGSGATGKYKSRLKNISPGIPKLLYFHFRIMHDLVLCKEIIFVNPYSAKKRSIQRSALWRKIAENLNSVKDTCFIVEKRSVQDHIAILIQRFKRQQAQELRKSGTTPQHTELDTAIE